MTAAVAALKSNQPTVPQSVPIVVLGTDALLAAAPSTPVQLAHACMRAGYANAIPASWGDELIAASIIRRLGEASGPVIQCSCPIVAHRLLSTGGDLRPVLVTSVSPPVAIARYVRALSQPQNTRITYVGACPGAADDAIDIRMSPAAFMALLAERNIAVDEQPRVFESVIPPDRRRYRSQPGGVPSPEALWNELGSRTLIEIDGEDFVTEIAQHLLSGKNALIDVSTRLGCACSGASGAATPAAARAAVLSMEPPRANTPIVEEHAPIELDAPLPAAPRTPIDVVAVLALSGPENPAAYAPLGGDMPFGHRISPVRAIASIAEPRSTRSSNPGTSRPSSTPSVSRPQESKTLPRTYVARRRSSPKGIPALTIPTDDGPTETPSMSDGDVAPAQAAAQAAHRAPEHEPTRSMDERQTPATRRADARFTLRQVLLILLATTAIAITVSTIVSVVVGRTVYHAADAVTPH